MIFILNRIPVLPFKQDAVEPGSGGGRMNARFRVELPTAKDGGGDNG